MPQGAIVTGDVKRLIAVVYREDKTQPAKHVRDEVQKRLGRGDWPKLSVIQRELKRIRDRDSELNRPGVTNEDSPWHLGDMLSHPIPAEALPFILLVQNCAEQYLKPPQSVTIRQALWIARLYAHTIAGGLNLKKKGDRLKIARFLYDWSKLYASYEIICELSETLLDTTELDAGLRSDSAPATLITAGEQWVWFNHQDKSFWVDPRTAKQAEELEKDGETK